jgi:hypothetical protein
MKQCELKKCVFSLSLAVFGFENKESAFLPVFVAGQP